MPDAPGMFSTTIGWPRLRLTPSARSRAITSVAAPGPVGTISFTGRVGQLCADAPAEKPSTAQQTANFTHARTRSLLRILRQAVYGGARRQGSASDGGRF